MTKSHEDYALDAALAFLTVAIIPNAPDHELTGNYQDLREEFVRRKNGLKTLRRMTKTKSESKDGLDRIVVKDGLWTFTVSGLNYYSEALAKARIKLGTTIE